MFENLRTLLSRKTRYEREFYEAVKNTSNLGLGSYTAFKNTDNRLITNESIIQLSKSIEHLNFTPDLLVAQCLEIHFKLKPYVDNFFGVNSTLTIGHVEGKIGGKAFYEPLEKRIEYLKTPVDIKSSINIHIWLTLPTLEILDFTLPSTLAKALDLKDLEGAIIGQHGDDDNDHFYKPEFVGKEYLYKTGLMRFCIY